MNHQDTFHQNPLREASLGDMVEFEDALSLALLGTDPTVIWVNDLEKACKPRDGVRTAVLSFFHNRYSDFQPMVHVVDAGHRTGVICQLPPQWSDWRQHRAELDIDALLKAVARNGTTKGPKHFETVTVDWREPLLEWINAMQRLRGEFRGH